MSGHGGNTEGVAVSATCIDHCIARRYGLPVRRRTDCVLTGYLWTKLGGLQVTMMVIYVVVLAESILLSILPASVTRGLAHAANAIIAQRLWLVIAVLTTTVVAYGISYVIASRIFASREW